MLSIGDKQVPQNHSDFSIDHILNRAGGANRPTGSQSPPEHLPWLQCTRYCPPKVPRAGRRDGPQRRQLGRHPRIPFTTHQLAVLEEKFKKSPYLSSEEVIILSQQLNLADVRVKIWFQNRRARERREKPQPQSQHEENSNERLNPESDGVLIKQEIVQTFDQTPNPANFLFAPLFQAVNRVESSSNLFLHSMVDNNR